MHLSTSAIQVVERPSRTKFREGEAPAEHDLQRLGRSLALPLLLMSSVLSSQCGSVMAAEPERQEVLIYYANETAPDAAEAQNYATIVEWLQSSDLAKAQAVAEGLKQDAVLFPQAVDAEVQAIQTHALENSSRLPVLIFTNRLAREGRCLVCDPRREREFRSVPFARHTSDNIIIVSNPLSQSTVLRQALQTAAETFDPHRHSFVLVTKSHGSPNLALTVKLARRARDVNREQLLHHLEAGTSDASTAIIGTTRDEYLAILRRAGDELGMSFPVAFNESCQGTFSPTQAHALPANVDVLFSSGQRYLEYRTLDYPELLGQVSASRSLSRVLSEFLQPRYLSISTPKAGYNTTWRWVWFAPLIAWVLWVSRCGCWCFQVSRASQHVVDSTAGAVENSPFPESENCEHSRQPDGVISALILLLARAHYFQSCFPSTIPRRPL